MDNNVDKTNVITRTNLGIIQSSADEMDIRRKNTAIIDYLCKLDEAKEWVSNYISKQLDLQTFLAELPKGEWLAEIVKVFDDECTERIYRSENREYLHTDNINMFLNWLKRIRLSRHFIFDVIDLYESKNIPKVIYCIHGLAEFLRIRGKSAGIEKNKNKKFTKEEEDLIQNDIHNLNCHKYEDIKSNMDSDEYVNENKTNIKPVSLKDSSIENELVDSINNISSEKQNQPLLTFDDLSDDLKDKINEEIQSFCITKLWKDSFENVIGREFKWIFALRKFITPEYLEVCKNQKLMEIQHKIFEEFKFNHKMKTEKDKLFRCVKLLLENQCKLRNLSCEEYPLANDFRPFKRCLYNLIQSPKIVYDIIQNDYELPLRTLFPDNLVGDYFFSRFVLENEYEPGIMQIASKHFMTSKKFENLSSLFVTTGNFDMSPVGIWESLYNSSPPVDSLYMHKKKTLMNEAIKDLNVRNEVVKRASSLMNFLSPIIDYFLTLELPYYVKVFASNSRFFEEFLEPSILLSNNSNVSNNFIACEILKYIFYKKNLFNNPTVLYENEKLFYFDCKFDADNQIDLSDYSPLKDYLESYQNFRDSFLNINTVGRISEHFKDAIPDGKVLQVEISLEEVNSIMVTLKNNMWRMESMMVKLVSNLYPLKQFPENPEIVPTVTTTEPKCIKVAPIVVDNQEIKPKIKYNPAPEEAIKIFDKPDRSSYMKERFVLKLDTEIVDLEIEDEIATNAIYRDVKSRIVQLIYLCPGNTLLNILASSDDECSSINGIEMSEFKENLRKDLDFLESKSLISKSTQYAEILDEIAKDLTSQKYKQEDEEANTLVDTYDELFKKGMELKSQLKSIYDYLNALSKSIVENKSGVIFNRQFGQPTKYGTYKFPLKILRPKRLDHIDANALSFIISMEEPLVFNLKIVSKQDELFSVNDVRFDELLRLHDDDLAYFEAGDLCSLSIGPLVEIINQQYIKN